MSSYIESQRKRAINIRNRMFRDPGGGIFRSQGRDFVLNDPTLNLWAGIRDDVIEYFKQYNIPFWKGDNNSPTGHLLSSQIACLNHLYFTRQRQDVATAILKNIDSNVIGALMLDSGFVEFEIIGKENYLGEKSHIRGANSTSIDALMLGELENKSRKLFFIEWKYTESYRGESLLTGTAGVTRRKIYTPLLKEPDSPIQVEEVESIFYEPYYQLMRQTLLAHKMTKANEYDAIDYVNIHVIPDENKELKERNTSKQLIGDTLEVAWKSVLTNPDKYISISPSKFISPAAICKDTTTIINYLRQRYW